jgi:hypothetical protein
MSRRLTQLWLLLVAGLLLAGCGGTVPATSPENTPDASEPASQTAMVSPVSPLSPLAVPSDVPAEVPGSTPLVVLHTNDNWGETEPCG